MELVAYIHLFRKWLWLIVLGAFLAGAAAFLYRNQQAEQYQATVTISVGGYIESPNPNSAQIQTGVELAQTYAVIATTYEVLEATVEAGDYPITPDGLGSAVTTSVVAETSLLRITVTYTDPALAASMANELAQQLISNSPSNLTPEQQKTVDSANAEIERLTAELEQNRNERSLLQEQLNAATDQDEIQRLQEQINVLADRINQTSSNIAGYQTTITTIQNRTNSLSIVERARRPGSPTGSSVLMNTLLGAMVGAALAIGLALLIEYLDDTIHTPEEVTQVLSLPTLATVTRFGRSRDSYSNRLITYHDPGAPVSEQYRTLRTNLLYSSNERGAKKIFIVSSPGPSEGKSVTVANLAVTIAMAGWRVLLVDADLRRPRIHEIFDLDNSVGLSTLLSAQESQNKREDHEGQGFPIDLTACLQETFVPGLRVIASGRIPVNPTEVLGSATMQHLFKEFGASKNVDIILFDTPPALVVADSAVLASTLNIPVVIVLESGGTRRAAAVRTKEQFEQLDVVMEGVVLNSVNPKERRYRYGGYGGYYYEYYSDESKSSS